MPKKNLRATKIRKKEKEEEKEKGEEKGKEKEEEEEEEEEKEVKGEEEEEEKKGENIITLLKRKIKRDKILSKKNKQELNKSFKSLSNSVNKQKKEDEIENQDDDLIEIKPISEYITIKKKEWENNKASGVEWMNDFSKSINILQDFNNTYLNALLSENQMETFNQRYKFLQFTLDVPQRKAIENKIKGKCNIPMIIHNFIPKYINDTKEIFIGLSKSIINIKKCTGEYFFPNLREAFNKNGVYLDEEFKPFIPVAFSNRELKINRLILEIANYFYQSSMDKEIIEESSKKLIIEKFVKFKKLNKIFDKIDFFTDDDELFEVFNYLFNCLFIYFDTNISKRDSTLLDKIILCCIPFDIDIAKKFLLNLMDIIIKNIIEIDGKDILEIDIDQINAKSEVCFKERNIKVFFSEINFNLEPGDFLELLQTDKFMLCFRFPKLSEINHLSIDKSVKNNYKKLFHKIIKSKIIEKAMNIDSDAKHFKYPFKEDKILEEVDKYTYLVPLPAENYFGVSDRITFSIYVNSFIDSSKISKIFVDIDNITKSRCHEIKHIYRTYMHINKKDISVCSPEIKSKSLDINALNKDNINVFQEKRTIINNVYSLHHLLINDKDEKLDYGDIMEYAINGNKQNVFFPKNSVFYLSENSWDLSIDIFEKRYFTSCVDEQFELKKIKDNDFINSLLDYLNITTKLSIKNKPDESKRSSKGNNDLDDECESLDNKYCIIDRASHFRK